MLSPYVLIYFTFCLFPILFSLGISFTDWDGFKPPTFIGLANYVQAFTKDALFLKSLQNTVILLFMITPVQLGLGLLMACLLKDFTKKSRGVFQLLNFLPYITTAVAVGIIFQLMFDWKSGVVNGFLNLFGIESKYWLGEGNLSRIVVAVMEIWKNYGYMMIMFMSGLSTIPDSLYEAAKMDGARWYHSFFHITIPLLRPIFTFCITTSVIGAFNLFDGPQLLFSGGSQPIGGPDRSVLTVVMRFYDASFESFQLGYGSALAYILFIIISVISFFMVRILNKGTDVE